MEVKFVIQEVMRPAFSPMFYHEVHSVTVATSETYSKQAALCSLKQFQKEFPEKDFMLTKITTEYIKD
jgi:hypothetical protein